MAYSDNVYRIANSVLERIREKNAYKLEKRKEEIQFKIPEYFELKKDSFDTLSSHVRFDDERLIIERKEQLKKHLDENALKRKELLKSNGFPEEYLDGIYDCTECRDTGYINGKRCKCFEDILRKTAIEESNISYILEDRDFKNFDLKLFSNIDNGNGISPRKNMKNILKHVKVFMDDFNSKDSKSMLFTGGTGVGKTFLSGCIAGEILKRNKNVLYQTAGKLTEILEEHKFNRENSIYDTSGLVHDLYNIDLLIIDDFGTEFKTSYTLTALFDLINYRLINNKKMIISTNLSPIELKNVYSERLFSRFVGEFLILEFIGEDLRTKKIFGN